MAGQPDAIQPITFAGVPAPETALAQPREETLPAALDYRLVIEQDRTTGTYIYKTVDRRTGALIHQTPRDDLLKLRHDPSYQPGAVVTASA